MTEAEQLALDNYREECSKVNTLPEVTKLPELECFAQNEFSVAAFEGDTMVGFLGCYNPWDGAFDSNVKGTFTPVHAHGCVKENRARIYERMYQQMAKLLVEQGKLQQICTVKRKKALKYAFEEAVVQKVMTKLRGIETDGSQGECLEHIREILQKEEFTVLIEDFNNM